MLPAAGPSTTWLPVSWPGRNVRRLQHSHQLDLKELTRLTGRGRRSAVGTYGFVQGGFLVETGKVPGESLAPLALRIQETS